MWSSTLLAALLVSMSMNMPTASAEEFAEDIFFIVSHTAPLTATRLDPVMSPGDISGHVHAIVGGSNFGPLYDYDKSQESQCTTANIAVDHSNYWVPQLYNKHENGTYSVAGLSFVQTYYQLRRQDDEPVYEFPPGFRMLAGDEKRRTLDLTDPAQDAVEYVCLNETITVPKGHVFPPGQCPHGMRAQIYFPHCWDGINSWLEGSKDVSYGEGRFDGGGKCPPTHPKRIMGLFYEFIFHDHEKYRKGGRVWSNGDDTGYGFHADFTNGWPVGFFSEFFDYGRQCSVGFGVKNCPALAPHVVDNQQCTYTGTKVDEDIGDQGAIPHLPGNNPSAADYQESATFNIGSPSPTQIVSIPATSIIIKTVNGDLPYSAVPDAIPQSGQQTTTPGSSVVAGPTATDSATKVAPTSLESEAEYPSSSPTGSATDTGASTPIKSAPTSLDPVESALPSVPGGGGVLIGDPASTASSASAPAATLPTTASESAVSSSRTRKTCPTGSRRGSNRYH